MAYDDGLAELLRGEFGDLEGVTEKKMFGGLCFLLNGNMVAGVHLGGGMARVGKEREAEALEIPGTAPLTFTGRPMGGIIDIDEELLADDARRAKVLAMALENAQSLPPK